MASDRNLSNSLRRRLVYASSLVPTGSMGRLCILTTGRTGSELLVELLDSHPRMRCEGEILQDPFRDPVRYVTGRAAIARLRKHDAYGFKINHLNARVGTYRTTLAQVVRDLADDGFTFVRIRRENLLRQTISSLRAGEEQSYHTREERHREALHLDPVHVIYLMRTIEVYEERIDSYVQDLDCMTLTYERDLESEAARGASLARVFALVGLEPAAVTTTLRQSTPRALADAVANHDELRDVLGKTRFAAYLFD